MSQSTPAACRARCQGCRRTYRVPDAERVYTCKACGGEVHRFDPHPLAVERAEVDPAEIEARRGASADLKRGYRWMRWITWLFRLGAFGYGLMTAAAVAALASPDVPLRPGVLVVVLSTALTVTMLMGAIQLLFAPFVWTLVVAILAAVVTAVHFVGPNPLGLAGFWSLGWALCFWAAVVPAWRFKRLIQAHLDLYVTHHASHATRRTLVGRSPLERHERLVRVMRRAFRRAIRASAVAGALIVLAAGVGAWFASSTLRPQELSEALAAFERAWREGDVEGLRDQFPPELRSASGARLAGRTRALGWQSALPELRLRSEWEGAEGSKWLEYEAPGGRVVARFVPQRRRWYLGQLDLPEPPIEPFVERLAAAWEASDPEALIELFPPRHAERMRASILNSLELRGWIGRFPPALDVRHDAPVEGAADVAIRIPGDRVVARWLLGPESVWRLNALRFPEL